MNPGEPDGSANTSASASSSARRQYQGPSSRRRLWLFRGTCVLLPLLCPMLLNLVLYWCGVGVDTTLVMTSRRLPDHTYFLNPRCDAAYCGVDLRGPEPRTFRLPKPEGVLRVIVAGASSVQGYPYPCELAFPHQMQLVLQRQLGGRRVEVLNAGIVGVSTTPLVDLVRQLPAAEPDVVVLYAGHNEFYGVGGVATNASIGRVGIRARHYRLGQAIHGLLETPDATAGELISRLPMSYEIPPGSELIPQAEQRYRANLEAIAEACAQSGIPLLICGVVSNLRDQGPSDVSNSGVGLPSAIAGESARLRSVAEDEHAWRRFTDAEKSWREALRIDDTSAVLHYRLAQCLLELGRAKEARQEFSRARDLDPCRYRAPSGIFGVAQSVAETYQTSGAQFVDLVQEFDAASPGGSPGSNFFLEHVHLNIDGHWLAARAIARTIVTDVLGRPWDERLVPTTSERDQWLDVIPQDRLVAYGLAWFLADTPPFNRALDSQRHRAALAKLIEDECARLPADEVRLFMSLPDQDKTDDLVNGMGRLLLARGQTNRALELFERAKRRTPWMPHSYVFAAICAHRQGRDADAIADVERSFQTPIVETDALKRDRDSLSLNLGLAAPNHDLGR